MGEKKEKSLSFDATMSLGDHLEELRARLLLALLGLAIGAIASLFFGKSIIKFIQMPYDEVMTKRAEERAEALKNEPNEPTVTSVFIDNLQKATVDPNTPTTIDKNTLQFVVQLYRETATSFAEQTSTEDDLMEVLMEGSRLQILALPDAFVGYMKISLIAGLILTSPWVFYQIWMFVAAGLYENERKYVHMAVPFSVVLFVTGALFFLFYVAKISLIFFITFGDIVGTQAGFTFQKYISFITILMLVFGIAFQTPIAIYILTKMGLVTIATLRASRKYIFLGMFVLAALITPPDVITQITLALPLYCLFELGILLSAITQRKKGPEATKQNVAKTRALAGTDKALTDGTDTNTVKTDSTDADITDTDSNDDAAYTDDPYNDDSYTEDPYADEYGVDYTDTDDADTSTTDTDIQDVDTDVADTDSDDTGTADPDITDDDIPEADVDETDQDKPQG
jgi:sec-independent protein translocase protein TatC